MASLGPHAGYIIACYGVTALVIGGLALWAVLADTRAHRDVAALEARRRPGGPT